ncbi:ICP22 family protein [Oceanicaulis alexandrii]|uniref:hypothetical protein n=1 Tax=Oceanicaulis alexandrii TaxID=153233 RepID=UPI0003B32F38|nr:hypothetical protein [Oceanicaulis alexandrii]
MANLPTAYASQHFGRKTLDFYAAAGEVSGSDPRARADEHSLTDYDGAKHTVRVMDRDFALEAGDQASVLRMQTGPSRRSRPVAVVNHTRQGWSRTHPGASAMLSRAGVARNVNWFLTVLLFALAAMVMVWPYLRTFLVEVDPSLFGVAPSFNIFALALGALPDLGNWSFSQTVSPVSALIAQSVPSMAEQADQIVFYALSGLGALVVFATRSWRLLWAPLFVGLVAAAALGLGGLEAAAGYAVIAYGVSAVIFMVGGVINRIRDAARLERRIALLADHLQRHAPEETIARTEEPEVEPEVAEVSEEAAEDTAAMSAVAAPVSAALSETGEEPRMETADEPAPGSSEDDAGAVDAEPEMQADAAQTDEAPTLEESAESSTDDQEDVVNATQTVSETVDGDLEVTHEPQSEAERQDEVVSSDMKEAEPALSEGDAIDEGSVAEAPAADETDVGAEEGAANAAVLAEDQQAVHDDATPDEADDGVEVEAELETELETSAEADALTSEVAEEAEPALALPETELDAGASEDKPEDEVELAGLDAEEAERMKNDPRYAARAIVLPSPPPMPSAEESTDTAMASAQPTTRETRELRPSAPLTNRVLSLFSNPVVPPAPPAPPAPSRSQEDEDA